MHISLSKDDRRAAQRKAHRAKRNGAARAAMLAAAIDVPVERVLGYVPSEEELIIEVRSRVASRPSAAAGGDGFRSRAAEGADGVAGRLGGGFSDAADAISASSAVADAQIEFEKPRTRAERRAAKAAAKREREAEKRRAWEQAHPEKAERRRAKEAARRRKGKRKRLPIWQIIIMLLGLALLAYPIVIDRISAYQADQAISSYTESVSQEPEEIARLFAQAQAHNDRLSNSPSDYRGEIPPEDELIVPGRSAFAWIEFPTLAERLPIFHGTDESSLQAGVGHLENTSMPIGGLSTHSVLTGHSGMPGNRMFDDIDTLEIGDVFMVHVLDRDLAYKVISSEVVWPDEVDSLVIQPGRDLVTLVTCTPYGVNDHRLLVHAERTDYDAALALPTNNMSLFFNQRTLPFIVAMVAMCLFFLFLTLHRRHRYPHELGVDRAWNGISDYTDDKRRYVGDRNLGGGARKRWGRRR